MLTAGSVCLFISSVINMIIEPTGTLEMAGKTFPTPANPSVGAKPRPASKDGRPTSQILGTSQRGGGSSAGPGPGPGSSANEHAKRPVAGPGGESVAVWTFTEAPPVVLAAAAAILQSVRTVDTMYTLWAGKDVLLKIAQQS